MKLFWRYGIIAGLFLTVFCTYPQFKLWYERGSDWNGHYAYNDIDEVAYASYVRALIDGRPRKNDPYTGRDQSPETPQPESLFSIQFAAPFTVAIPARILGIGAPWAMTIAGAVAGFLAAFAVFWFIGRLTGDSLYGMAAALGVFCFGTLASGEGAISEILFDGFSYPYFPGFRRYIPAMAFPAFFLMVGAVWKLLAHNHDEQGKELSDGALLSKQNVIWLLVAAASFAYTVYSYFYVWTTAAALLACVFLIWLIERPDGWKRDLKLLSLLSGICGILMIPYVYLLSQRVDTMDHVQLLVHTRMPDLFRFPEYVSFAVLLILIGGLAAKLISLKDRSVLFILAITLVPFAVFNQQIVTGRSLQPIHYQVFIGNYVATLAVFALIGLLWKKRLELGGFLPKFACVAIALAAIVWGFVECHYTVRVLDWANAHRDKGLPVAHRLEELGNGRDAHRMTVLSYDGIFADDMPTVAPQNILWARHQHVYAGLSWEESKERYYQQLYYQGIDGKGLDYLLKNDFVSMIALFGWGRHTDRLSSEAKPLTYGEIADEVRLYERYIADYSPKQAGSPLISFVVVKNDDDVDMSNLKQWYELHDPEVIGEFTLHKASPRWLKGQ